MLFTNLYEDSHSHRLLYFYANIRINPFKLIDHEDMAVLRGLGSEWNDCGASVWQIDRFLLTLGWGMN